LLLLAASLNLRLGSADISSAFLNGMPIDRQLWMQLPRDLNIPGVRNQGLVRIIKGVYGLRSAPRQWWMRLREALTNEMHFTACKVDPTPFIYRKGNRISCIVGCHVDDLLIAADKEGWAHVKRLEKIFSIKSWSQDGEIVYCGRRLTQLPNGSITVCMSDYVDTLSLIRVEEARKKDLTASCNLEEVKAYRSLLGGLGWLATMGRPDISYSVSRLQGFLSGPTVQHLLEANQVVRDARKYRETRLLFQPLDLSTLTFCAVSDASFGNMPQGKSQTGIFILAGDSRFEKGELAPVNFLAWRSGRQKRVARSTFGAELLALSDAVDLGDYCRGLWSEIQGVAEPRLALEQRPSLFWMTDSRDLFDALRREGAPNCSERRLALDLVVMKELLSRPFNFLKWVDTAHMLSDSLTKSMVFKYF
jgi:hypothetical protein